MSGVTATRAPCAARESQGTVKRDARRERRQSEIPETFDCVECAKPIEGAVVFWWTGYGRRSLSDTWCEPCWAAMRTANARELHERYGDEPSVFGRLYPDPDEPGYNPFDGPHGFEVTPCGSCGRPIRWGNPSGYCCFRCFYEAANVLRRVKHDAKPCESCGESFTPKRSDARTCSDRCRQRLSRAQRAGQSATDNRDKAES